MPGSASAPASASASAMDPKHHRRSHTYMPQHHSRYPTAQPPVWVVQPSVRSAGPFGCPKLCGDAPCCKEQSSSPRDQPALAHPELSEFLGPAVFPSGCRISSRRKDRTLGTCQQLDASALDRPDQSAQKPPWCMLITSLSHQSTIRHWPKPPSHHISITIYTATPRPVRMLAWWPTGIPRRTQVQTSLSLPLSLPVSAVAANIIHLFSAHRTLHVIPAMSQAVDQIDKEGARGRLLAVTVFGHCPRGTEAFPPFEAKSDVPQGLPAKLLEPPCTIKFTSTVHSNCKFLPVLDPAPTPMTSKSQ
ncbi:hypothetical protein S7711_10557 [Stachybotrys chartarum IBT 7711]|uniref:Uncharacterized protein n=1 Tax=Stachybotrys chartarum (strain CBS 109288 / IBT 7711) TaxID=1280523 RepID=A0A084AZC9_STACB|nr:hypothetical protein S7711_10557 [Stachybotrys chartarum IBT 7711]